MNLLRAGVLAALAVTIATGVVSIWVVLAAMFALGVSETVADITAPTVLPSLVDPDDLGIANARLQTTFITVNQLAGPPIGAFLFAAARWLPFSTTAVCFVLGAVLFARVVLTPVAEVHTSGKSMRHDIVDGIRWLWHHRAMRTLALTIILFNVTFGAAWGVLVLWAQQRLGLDAVGFGALTTISALGGLLGTLLYGRLAARFSLGNIMRAGLIIETLTHLAFALTAHPWVAYIVMFLFGGHAFIWGTTSTTVRQRAVPAHLMGRVGAVYVVGMVGGIVLGNPIGGFLARHFGMTAPYWLPSSAQHCSSSPSGASSSTSPSLAPTTRSRVAAYDPSSSLSPSKGPPPRRDASRQPNPTHADLPRSLSPSKGPQPTRDASRRASGVSGEVASDTTYGPSTSSGNATGTRHAPRPGDSPQASRPALQYVEGVPSNARCNTPADPAYTSPCAP